MKTIILSGGASFVLLCALSLGSAATLDPEIEARISIPRAETYVLGDDIPIIWEFTNRSTNSVAMLWEGCCRLNGKLDVSSGGSPVEILPPGAATFHSYSKAAELKPDEPGQFSSLLSDWVQLPSGGTFQIGGRYTGVLPSQSPQVEEGLSLWRGTATAAPDNLLVLSVDDYLSQREDRSVRRGLKFSLQGPEELPPLMPVEFVVTIQNAGSSVQQIAWPGAVQLWIVDENGFRLPGAVRQIRQPGESFLLRPRETAERKFSLDSSDFNGSSFGRYQVFIDASATKNEELRVPSNSIEIEWDLPAEKLTGLLVDAASGSTVGMRNPALKLLRVYLSALGEHLAQVPNPELSSKAVSLKDQLLLANCLKPLAPKPGVATLSVMVGPTGDSKVRLPNPGSCQSFGRLSGLDQLAAAYEVRRHLGWDIRVNVEPALQTHVESMFEIAELAEARGIKMSGPVSAALIDRGGVTNLVQLQSESVGANVVVRLDIGSDQGTVRVAVAKPDPEKPVWMQLFRASQVLKVDTVSVEAGKIADWVRAQQLATPQILVVVNGSMNWGQLKNAVTPLWELSSRINVLRSAD